MNTKTTKERMENVLHAIDIEYNYGFKELPASIRFKGEHIYNFYHSLSAKYRENYIETLESHPGNMDAIDAVLNLDIKNGENLVIYSNNSGNGKTKLGIAGLYHHIFNTTSPNPHYSINHCTVGFVNLVDYFAKSADNNFEGAKHVLPNLSYPDLLLIDDAGKSKPSDYVYQKFYGVMENRWSNNKSTIFTSNYALTDLADRVRPENSIDNALYSRIMSGKVVEIIGKDRR